MLETTVLNTPAARKTKDGKAPAARRSRDALYGYSFLFTAVIAGADDIRIQSTGPKQQSFELWDQQRAARTSLQEFLRKSVY